MARLTVHNVESVPEAAKERVEKALKTNGFLPNLIGVLANAPAALAMYQEVGALNAGTSLSAGEREVVQITTAVLNGCEFCKAGHTALSTKKKLLDPATIEALRNTRTLSDPKLNRLALFTQAVIAKKGNVDDAELQAFFDAGYSEQQALEVVLGVALATLSNYANNLSRAEINEQLLPFA
ncbi:carboxymuconolactone decarboxylase family protein [Neisseria weaveri]|uniref:carboxymuconolactone decarboxylase family protein n=1 Tax=Neisseria weaveri TaxID=28091 RepID=UPI000D2F7DB1|nr:carboxymuconolactone decarboxylase family protein [Neisseria weaveri]